MKYKLIKGLAHNFTASFISGVCWSNVEELKHHVWNQTDRKFVIYWKPAVLGELEACSLTIRTYFCHYLERLPIFVSHLSLDYAKLVVVMTEFRYNKRLTFEAETLITDDRSKVHRALVR